MFILGFVKPYVLKLCVLISATVCQSDILGIRCSLLFVQSLQANLNGVILFIYMFIGVIEYFLKPIFYSTVKFAFCDLYVLRLRPMICICEKLANRDPKAQ